MERILTFNVFRNAMFLLSFLYLLSGLRIFMHIKPRDKAFAVWILVNMVLQLYFIKIMRTFFEVFQNFGIHMTYHYMLVPFVGIAVLACSIISGNLFFAKYRKTNSRRDLNISKAFMIIFPPLVSFATMIFGMFTSVTCYIPRIGTGHKIRVPKSYRYALMEKYRNTVPAHVYEKVTKQKT